MMRPMRELKDFNKKLIKIGETEHFEFELGYKELGFYDTDGNYLIENVIFMYMSVKIA